MESLQLNTIDRPTFYYNNDETKPIRAGGVIIYREINNKIQFLLIKKCYNNIDRYEDIGGKTDVNDITQYDTIAREVSEETNLVINQNVLKYQLSKSSNIYVPYSKYLLYLVEANVYERNLKPKYFGDKEIHDDIDRTIVWVDIDSYLDNKLNFNPRMTSEHVKSFIRNHFNKENMIENLGTFKLS
jgi:8-oxo-dGTP pyrophosphatase MutT (NUDIX family)